ncbi:hypothetical protein D5086_017747 [Populus alba]|uniref:Uncharacterized protein n=1 Tax=Populus alba TaxID=43335 RepID=A0ACC4BMX9_POPAL
MKLMPKPKRENRWIATMTVTSGLARTASQKQRSPTSMQIERTPGFTTAHKHFNYYTDRTLSFVEQWAQLSSLNQLMSVC